jgi:hypothetical protein
VTEVRTGGRLDVAACGVGLGDLPLMLLDGADLPAELRGYETLADRNLDNEAMAETGLGGRTASGIADLGRIGGVAREFAAPRGAATLAEEPAEVLQAATVVHLFRGPLDVEHWIDQVFMREMRERVGQEEPEGGHLAGAELVEAKGFHEHAAGLMLLHQMQGVDIASTIIDFQLGCLLGVAYVVAKRDVVLRELATDLAQRLERRMVSVVLG